MWGGTLGQLTRCAPGLVGQGAACHKNAQQACHLLPPITKHHTSWRQWFRHTHLPFQTLRWTHRFPLVLDICLHTARCESQKQVGLMDSVKYPRYSDQPGFPRALAAAVLRRTQGNWHWVDGCGEHNGAAVGESRNGFCKIQTRQVLRPRPHNGSAVWGVSMLSEGEEECRKARRVEDWDIVLVYQSKPEPVSQRRSQRQRETKKSQAPESKLGSRENACRSETHSLPVLSLGPSH